MKASDAKVLTPSNAPVSSKEAKKDNQTPAAKWFRWFFSEAAADVTISGQAVQTHQNIIFDSYKI